MTLLSRSFTATSAPARIAIAVAGTFLFLLAILAIVRPDMMDLMHRAMNFM